MVMKYPIKIIPLATSVVTLLVLSAGHAQTSETTATAPPTRAEIKMETAEFLKTHRWDDEMSAWVLKSGVETSVGIKSRAEVKSRARRIPSHQPLE